MFLICCQMTNYLSDRYSTLQGLPYEIWEKKYIYSYFIFIGIFQALKQITTELYLTCSKITLSKGIPILIPLTDKKGYKEAYLYPNREGDVWRFTKTI